MSGEACERCGVVGAALATEYRGLDFERRLCACCRIACYNRRFEGREVAVHRVAPDNYDIALRFALMAQAAIAKGERRRARRAARPQPAPGFLAHSLPPEAL